MSLPVAMTRDRIIRKSKRLEALVFWQGLLLVRAARLWLKWFGSEMSSKLPPSNRGPTYALEVTG